MNVREMLSTAMELPPSRLDGIQLLAELEKWDSLAILNFMAMVDTHYGVTLSPEKLLQCESIGDVESLIASARTIDDESVYQVN
jgi:acyl carrier protein